MAVKNIAELAVLVGLFSFIGKNYDSDAATIISIFLKGCLGLLLGLTVQRLAFVVFNPKPGHKSYVASFIVSGVLGMIALLAINFFLIMPVLGAIERQLAATPPALQLQASPSLAGTRDPRSPGTSAPKPAAVPSAAEAAALASSAPPSAVPSRSSSPEARKPD